MVRNKLILAAAILSGVALATPAAAQNEQFIPILSYRTGAYAVNGVPFANGMADYYNLIYERDGGINGVKLLVEECETGYATDKGVECYERLKGKGRPARPSSIRCRPALHSPSLKRPRLTRSRLSRWAMAGPIPRTEPCSRTISRCSARTGPRPISRSSTSPRSSAASTS